MTTETSPQEHFPASSANTADPFQIIQTTLSQLHSNYEELRNRLYDATNKYNQLRNECRELEGKCSLLLQQNQLLTTQESEAKQQLNEVQHKFSTQEALHAEQLREQQAATEEQRDLAQKLTQELSQQASLIAQQHEVDRHALKDLEQKLVEKESIINEQNRVNGQLTKANHDLELALLEESNAHKALKTQASVYQQQTEKKLTELNRASSAVEKMRQMLAGVESMLPSHTTETTTPADAGAQRTTDDSFDRWLNPREPQAQNG